MIGLVLFVICPLQLVAVPVSEMRDVVRVEVVGEFWTGACDMPVLDLVEWKVYRRPLDGSSGPVLIGECHPGADSSAVCPEFEHVATECGMRYMVEAKIPQTAGPTTFLQLPVSSDAMAGGRCVCSPAH